MKLLSITLHASKYLKYHTIMPKVKIFIPNILPFEVPEETNELIARCLEIQRLNIKQLIPETI